MCSKELSIYCSSFRVSFLTSTEKAGYLLTHLQSDKATHATEDLWEKRYLSQAAKFAMFPDSRAFHICKNSICASKFAVCRH